MPASIKKGYYQQKTELLKGIKRHIEEERAAIDILDLEKLSKAIRDIEKLKSKMDRLEHEQESKDTDNRLTERERDTLTRSLQEIVRMRNENLKRLQRKKDSTLKEIKAVRQNKSAHKAYGASAGAKGMLNKSH